MHRMRTAIFVFAFAAGMISSSPQAAYVDNVQRTWEQTGPPPAPSGAVFLDLRSVLDAENRISDAALDMRFSSLSLLGRPVYDRDGAWMGSLNDILVDAFGNPVTAVISANAASGSAAGLIGLNYTDVIDMNAPPSKLTVIKPVSKDMLENARAGTSPPPSGVAVSALANLQVKTVSGNTIGQLGNFVFGRTTEPYFAVTLGPGGAAGQALMRFKDLQRISSVSGPYIQLTQAQSDFLTAHILQAQTLSSAGP